MKSIEVSAAVIIRQNSQTNKKEIFTTQRGYGDFKGGWEFPGGKVEKNESPQDCIVREIREELNISVQPQKILSTVDYDYPTFHITMHCILCTILSGQPTLLEHEAAKWLTKETLNTVNWLPADRLVLQKVEEIL